MEDLCSMFEHGCADTQEFDHDYDDGFATNVQSLGMSLGLAEIIAEEEKDNYNIIDEEAIVAEYGESTTKELHGQLSGIDIPEFEQYVNNICGI